MTKSSKPKAGAWTADRNLIVLLFTVAVLVRLVYLADYRDIPYYDRPFSDSAAYQQRAVEIVSGDFWGDEVFFLGSPLYPYFMAAIYEPFGVNITLLLFIQALVGGLTCVLVYLLTRMVPGASPARAFVAGLFAAAYGTLVFYSATLLMTTLELFLVCAALTLLVWSQRPGDREDTAGKEAPERRLSHTLAAFASGLLMGLAALGRPNVIVFVPFALLWVFTGFNKAFWPRRWRHGVLFALGCVVAVAPVAIRNYVVSRDLVLVSSSAGVNFFIGNNAEATGRMTIPPSSGIQAWRIFDSSREVAQAATGFSDIKPSQVSDYWAGRASDFIKSHPGHAGRLLLTKLDLFWNRYEIPNLYNMYYTAGSYAPSLRWIFVGFGIIAPLALAGIVLVFATRPVPAAVRLYLGFLAVYMISVIPFFVTARYRIAVVPLLIVFAAAGLWDAYGAARRRQYRWLAVAAALGIASAFWVNHGVTEANYAVSRAIAGKSLIDMAREQPQDASRLLRAAIVDLKKAVELAPKDSALRFELADAYLTVGFYSEALSGFEAVLEGQPSNRLARDAAESARRALEEDGDQVGIEAIPSTPLETAIRHRRAGDEFLAEQELKRAIAEDPQHARAHNELGSIYADHSDFDRAVRQYRRGLLHSPDNPVLLNNLANAYYGKGDFARARRQWERCLEIAPGDENAIRGLRLLDER